MSDGTLPSEKPVSPSPRPAKRRLTFVTLAGVLAIVGALAAGYYFAMRPVTLTGGRLRPVLDKGSPVRLRC